MRPVTTSDSDTTGVADGITQLGDCGVGKQGDTALVACIERHRHSAALAEVYRRHGGSVDDLAARICGSERSGEVVQAVLLDLWHRPGRFKPDRSSLRNHLLADAHSLAIEIVRARPTRRARRPMSPFPRRSPPMAPAPRVGHHAGALLAPLPTAHQTAIGLAYFGGYHTSEVAALLDQSQGAVNRQIRAGLIEMAKRCRTSVGDQTEMPNSSGGHRRVRRS